MGQMSLIQLKWSFQTHSANKSHLEQPSLLKSFEDELVNRFHHLSYTKGKECKGVVAQSKPIICALLACPLQNPLLQLLKTYM